jgi:septation ring formation regulator EzrA
MADSEHVNRELIEDVNKHLNSIEGDLREIHSDIQEVVTIEEREAEELSPQDSRAFPDEERAVSKLNSVLNRLETILDDEIEAITNMDRFQDFGNIKNYDTGDPGVLAAVNYIRVVARLGKTTIQALQVQIKFEAEVENLHTLKNGDVDLSENQRQYIQRWIQDCLEILEDVKEILEEVLDFGEQMIQKHEDWEGLLQEYVEEYSGNMIGGEIERIEREEKELEKLARNIK